jgi:hypothetical protein
LGLLDAAFSTCFVLGLFQQRFAGRVQKKPNTVIEGGPIYFFDLVSVDAQSLVE